MTGKKVESFCNEQSNFISKSFQSITTPTIHSTLFQEIEVSKNL